LTFPVDLNSEAYMERLSETNEVDSDIFLSKDLSGAPHLNFTGTDFVLSIPGPSVSVTSDETLVINLLNGVFVCTWLAESVGLDLTELASNSNVSGSSPYLGHSLLVRICPSYATKK
jgi:hypothetical protein